MVKSFGGEQLWQEEEIGIIFQHLFARSAVRKCRFRDGMDIEERKDILKIYIVRCVKQNESLKNILTSSSIGLWMVMKLAYDKISEYSIKHIYFYVP